MRARSEIEHGRATASPSSYGDPLPGQQGPPSSRRSPSSPARSGSGASRTSATRAIARACASWSTSRGASRPRSSSTTSTSTPAPGHVRDDLSCHRGPAPTRPEPPRGLRALPRLPPRRRAPEGGVRAPEGGGPGPRARGLRDRPRPPRRGDRPHRESRTPEDRQRGPRRALRPHRGPGRRDPEAPAAAADRPRAAEDRGRARRAAGADRDLKDILASPKRIDAVIGGSSRRSGTPTGTRGARRSSTRRKRSTWRT